MTTFKKVLPLLVGVPFTLYSGLVIFEHGYFGFLTLAGREPWAMQMLLDLTISLFLVGAWIRRDAARLGLWSMPYLVLLPFLGSPVALAYLVRRALLGSAPSLPREGAVHAAR